MICSQSPASWSQTHLRYGWNMLKVLLQNTNPKHQALDYMIPMVHPINGNPKSQPPLMPISATVSNASSLRGGSTWAQTPWRNLLCVRFRTTKNTLVIHDKSCEPSFLKNNGGKASKRWVTHTTSTIFATPATLRNLACQVAVQWSWWPLWPCFQAHQLFVEFLLWDL